MIIAIKALAVLILLVIAFVVVVVIATQSLPNQLEFHFLANLSMYLDLLYANPSVAANLFLLKPVFIIQNMSAIDDLQATSSQVWGVYFMPLTVVVLFVLSVFIVQIKKLSPSLSVWAGLIGASALLSASVFYLRVQTCCTESPSWLLDVIILSRVFNPLLNSNYWQDLYMAISPWFNSLQILMMSLSLVILYFCFSVSKKQ